MKKFVTSLLLLAFLTPVLPVFSDTIWADDSVNDDIVKQYNTNKINEDFLPALPDSLKNEAQNGGYVPPKVTVPAKSPQPLQTQSKTPVKTISSPKPIQNYTDNNFKDAVVVKSGTKFRLRLETAISDATSKGTRIYFTSLYPEINRYVTIPAGTRFVGVIEDSHTPQMGANGGLLVIKINQMIYKGKNYPIDAQVVMVGDKRIYLNNIKGKHTYWKSLVNSTKPGRKFYSKSWRVTKKFAGDGLEIILTPITFVGGVAVLAANTVASPLIALTSKGGRLFLYKGTQFKIKLMEDTLIYQ